MVIKKQARQVQSLQVGQRVRVRRLVRVGSDSWWAELTGVVRRIQSVPTGIHTDRRPQDDLWVDTVTIEKSDGELSVVVVDEHTELEPVSG